MTKGEKMIWAAVYGSELSRRTARVIGVSGFEDFIKQEVFNSIITASRAIDLAKEVLEVIEDEIEIHSEMHNVEIHTRLKEMLSD